MRHLLHWLGFPSRESTYRDLLAWLIDVAGEPALTAIVGFETGPVDAGSLTTERALTGAPKTTSKMRLDLYVESERAVVGIEMKVHSSAGAGQLDAYATWLKERAGNRKATLVFLTETGAVPEYPDEFRERIKPVDLLCVTWDRVAELIPANEPLGWRPAAIERAREIRQQEDLVCGAGRMAPVQKMDDRLANVHARGILALAKRVAAQTGLRHVHGPTFGAYHLDPTVDLAKPGWTVDLGFADDALRRANPLFDARLRFAIRVRFRENEQGELILGIGSTFVPYPPDIGPKSKREPVMAKALLARQRGLALRRRLIDQVPGAEPMSHSDWYLSHILVDDWTGNRVECAAQALSEAIPRIDAAVAGLEGVLPPS